MSFLQPQVLLLAFPYIRHLFLSTWTFSLGKQTMFRRAVCIPLQLPHSRLTIIRSSASTIASNSPRQFHASVQPRISKFKGSQANRMSDDTKSNQISCSNSHLDTSIADDPSDRHAHEGESWKYRAPYQIQKDDEFGPVKWEGMCHCGNVQYQIKDERPLAAKYCHCRACQVLHGIPLLQPKESNIVLIWLPAAPFQWCAIFRKTDIRFKQGTDSLMFYSSHEKSKKYQVPTKVYCSNCNSPIMDEGRNMCLIFPELMDLGQTEEEHLIRRKVFEIEYVSPSLAVNLTVKCQSWLRLYLLTRYSTFRHIGVI